MHHLPIRILPILLGLLAAIACAGCKSYELFEVEPSPVFLVEQGELREMREATVREWVANDPERLLSSYMRYLFIDGPPVDRAELSRAMRGMPRSRDLGDDPRNATLLTVAHAMLDPNNRPSGLLHQARWYLVGNDPLTLAAGPLPGETDQPVRDPRRRMVFVTADDLEVEVTALATLPWSWSLIDEVWRMHAYPANENLLREAVRITRFDRPRTIREVQRELVEGRAPGTAGDEDRE